MLFILLRDLELLSPASRRLKPLEVLKYFEGIVRAEIDLEMESAAAAEFHSIQSRQTIQSTKGI